MSDPRYVLTLRVAGTEFSTSIRLKSVLGDHQGLQDELAIMAEKGEVAGLAESFTKSNGGLEAMRGVWVDSKEEGWT
tara:strand:- start:995 stop:1225 length:231 start_codon:yes stop_codon:yes gene_type:complete